MDMTDDSIMSDDTVKVYHPVCDVCGRPVFAADACRGHGVPLRLVGDE